MKKRYSEEQIIGFLSDGEAGIACPQRKHHPLRAQQSVATEIDD